MLTQLPDTCVTWTPGHAGMLGNEAAHAAARGHTSRAFLPPTIRVATGAAELPTSYAAILQHYRLERREYPPPYPGLTKEESVILRRLQTNTYTHGIYINRIYPTEFPYLCPHCNEVRVMSNSELQLANTVKEQAHRSSAGHNCKFILCFHKRHRGMRQRHQET